MKNNIKILRLVENGFKAKNLMSMSEKSIDTLYSRLMEQVKPVTSTETKYEIGDQGGSLPPSPKGYTVKKGSDGKVMAEPNEGEMSEENLDNSNALGKLAMQKVSGEKPSHDSNYMAPDGMDDDSDNDRDMMGEGEIDEKSVSKQQQKFFGVVKSMQDGDTPMKGKAGKAAKEMTKKEVDDFASTKHKGLPKKKETKENYLNMVGNAMAKNLTNKVSDIRPGLKFESIVEKELSRIVEKHLPTKISKKDFVDLVNESPEIAPSKPKIKPGTKPNKPSTPYSPKPGPKPAPKADTKQAPVKPTIKPGTKPNRPATPYSPKPGPKPAPKAEKKNIPDWLQFNKIGINLK